MKRGRAGRSRHRALIVALALALASATAVPIVSDPMGTVRCPGRYGQDRAQLGWGAPSAPSRPSKPRSSRPCRKARRSACARTWRTPSTTPTARRNGGRSVPTATTAGWQASTSRSRAAATPDAPAHRAAGRNASLGGESADDGARRVCSSTRWQLANAAAMVAEPDGVNVREDPGSESPARQDALL